MLNNRLSAARSVSERLTATEAAIDAALQSAAELAASLPAARFTARVSALIGQDAIAETAVAIAALASARGAVVAAHKTLDEARHQVGLGHFAIGDGMPKPKVAGAFQNENVAA